MKTQCHMLCAIENTSSPLQIYILLQKIAQPSFVFTSLRLKTGKIIHIYDLLKCINYCFTILGMLYIPNSFTVYIFSIEHLSYIEQVSSVKHTFPFIALFYNRAAYFDSIEQHCRTSNLIKIYLHSLISIIISGQIMAHVTSRSIISCLEIASNLSSCNI